MSDSTSLCNSVSKPLSIFIKLADDDRFKTEKIKKIINDNLI